MDGFSAKPDMIVSGGARGADTLAERYAADNAIPLRVFHPNWKEQGRAAGMIRNLKIVQNSTYVVAFLGPKSRGTKNTIKLARELGIPVHIEYVDQ